MSNALVKCAVSKVNIRSYGGIGDMVQSLTGSCHEITIVYVTGEEKKILIDVGMFQGKGSGGNAKLLFTPSQICAVIVTHGHIDHCGRLAMLFNHDMPFTGRIFTTELTKQISNFALLDCAKILTDDADKKQRRYEQEIAGLKSARKTCNGAMKKGVKRSSSGDRNERHDARPSSDVLASKQALLRSRGIEVEADIHAQVQKPDPPLFTKGDVEAAFAAMTTVEMSTKVDMIWQSICPEVEFCLWNAGHVAGSVSVLVRVHMGRGKVKHLFFSGDIGSPKIPFHPFGEAEVPDIPLDMVMLETTYGDKVRPDFEIGFRDFEESIKKASETRERLVIPAFALDRVQAVLYYLVQLKQEGKLNATIYLDTPLGEKYTALYAQGEACGNMLIPGSDTFTVITSKTRQEALSGADFKVIVTSSGMATGGPILWYLQKYLGAKGEEATPTTTFFFMGYMAEGTIGRKLIDGMKMVEIPDEQGKMKPVEVFARVKAFNFFSGHADQSDLWEWYKCLRLKKTAKVVLIHGEQDSSTREFMHFLLRRKKDNPDVMIPPSARILIPDVDESYSV